MNLSNLTPSVVTAQNQQGNAQVARQGGGHERNPIVKEAVTGPSHPDKRQAALDVVNKTLAAAYEKLGLKTQSTATVYDAFEPLTAEKVASNILGFIERRLQLDVADGATPEQLQARLDAGLAGFKKGFAEASEKLEALSLLSPEIKADIGKTYDLVLSGVDELRKKFLGALETPTMPEGGTKQALSTVADKSPATLKVPDFLPAATSSYLGYGNYEYGRAREFSFELTTKEGDKVTIKASSSEGFALEAGRASRGGSSASSVNASYSSSSAFSIEITGELSDAELTAINDLLGRVNELAGQFFAGNLDSAFEQALSLGYNEKQIGSFALNLAQAEIQQVTRAYQVTEPAVAGVDQSQLLTARLLPMGEFIRALLESLDRASVFDQPKLLLATTAEQVPNDEKQGHRFREFVEQILALDLR